MYKRQIWGCPIRRWPSSLRRAASTVNERVSNPVPSSQSVKMTRNRKYCDGKHARKLLMNDDFVGSIHPLGLLLRRPRPTDGLCSNPLRPLVRAAYSNFRNWSSLRPASLMIFLSSHRGSSREWTGTVTVRAVSGWRSDTWPPV